jgi:DNA-binding transcriptional MocR family regulator
MTKARYIRLADMLGASIREGKWAPGAKLPTQRAFAETFGIALATATRTYRELERRGVIVGEAGRGTFVRDPGVPLASGFRQTDTEGMVDLVFNMPGDSGDADSLRVGLRQLAAAGDLDSMLRYHPHGGRSHERKIIAASLIQTLGPIDPQHLLVTSGAQHGLAIIGFGVLKHGDAVATDTLTYPGFKSVAALQGLDLVPIAAEQGVMSPDDLDRHCRMRKLSAIYLMPTVHSPLGTVMDEATRLRIVTVARRHDLLIVEDAAYAFLEVAPPPSFVSLAPERTVHVGGFSKSLATGLRLGYVIAPDRHIDRLTEAIRATTWNAPALISGLVTGWIEDGTLRRSEDARRQDGAERQTIFRRAFGDMPRISHPNAGFG